MPIYDDLGVRRVVNAAAALTRLGGSLMPPVVLEAMHDAAGSFVNLPELHDRVGEQLAELTHNEAACVSCGAAAGILQTVAACIAGNDQERVSALPVIAGVPRHEVIYFRDQWNGFLSSAKEAGARLIEVGPQIDELEAAIGARTAAIIWFAGIQFAPAAPPIDEIITVAHRRNVPVIVDAADQVPPISTLWHFTRDLGADLAIVSGGKGLCGPQASGLIVGRRDLIKACRANGGPSHSIGRPAKVGKEEMVGLLAAVKWSIAQDTAQVRAGYEDIVQRWISDLSQLTDARVSYIDHSHSGQPIPRAIVRFSGGQTQRDALVAALWERSPRIAVMAVEDDGIGLNPQFVADSDADLVVQAIRAELAAA